MRPDTFIIKKVEVDLVYGKSISNACNKRQAISQKTSLTFLSADTFLPNDVENNYGHLTSGAPGYIKGQPILIGQETTEMVSND